MLSPFAAHIPRVHLVHRAVPGLLAVAAASAFVVAGCGESTAPSPGGPADGPPEGRQIAPGGWLVLGGPIAWSAATDEILAMGAVLAVPPSSARALHGIDAVTGAYRVIDYEGIRLGVSGSGNHVYFTWVTGPPDPPVPQLVERSLGEGGRRVWDEGVRFVLSAGDSLLAYSTAPWTGMIDSLIVERLSDGSSVARMSSAIPLAFSPEADQVLVWNGSYASPDHRVLTLADGVLDPLPLGIPVGASALEPPWWDARGVLVLHVSGGPDSTVATLRNVTTGIETVLHRAQGAPAGPPTVVWSRDGRYAAYCTQKGIPVPDQPNLAREISVWVTDTVQPAAWRIAFTVDALPGRPIQTYSGTFSPDGDEFAWEAGGTLFVAPIDGER